MSQSRASILALVSAHETSQDCDGYLGGGALLVPITVNNDHKLQKIVHTNNFLILYQLHYLRVIEKWS